MNKALQRPQSDLDKKVYDSMSAKAYGSKLWKEKQVLKLRNGKELQVGKKEVKTVED